MSTHSICFPEEIRKKNFLVPFSFSRAIHIKMTSHKWNIIHLVQVLSELTFNMFSNKRIFHYISSINFKYLLKFIYIIILVCAVMKITKK